MIVLSVCLTCYSIIQDKVIHTQRKIYLLSIVGIRNEISFDNLRFS